MRPTERAREILDDPPVLPRLARAIDRLVDLDDPPLDLRDRALVLFLQTARQHDIGVTGGVVEEEIDRDVELELLEASVTKLLSGSETFGLKQIEIRPLISPASIFRNIS